MIIELSEKEKEIMSRALVMFSLDPNKDEEEEDIKNLWIRINSIARTNNIEPEYFTLEDSNND